MGCVNSKVTEAVETTQDTPRSARSRRSSADDADPVMFTAPDENETHEPDPIEITPTDVGGDPWGMSRSVKHPLIHEEMVPAMEKKQATLAPMDEIEEFDLEFDMDSPRGTQV